MTRPFSPCRIGSANGVCVEAVDDLADDVGALVAEEQRRRAPGSGSWCAAGTRRAAASTAAIRSATSRRRSSKSRSSWKLVTTRCQVSTSVVLGRVVRAVGRQRRGLVVLEVLGRDGGAHEDEVVVEVAAVQDLGRHRVEERLGALGLVVVDEQADVVELDLLPDLHRQRRRLELVLQPLGRLGDAPLVVGDALRLRLLLAVPVGRLEARLRLRARLAEQPVVAVEAVEHRPRDVEGARVGERCRKSRELRSRLRLACGAPAWRPLPARALRRASCAARRGGPRAGHGGARARRGSGAAAHRCRAGSRTCRPGPFTSASFRPSRLPRRVSVRRARSRAV